MAAVGPSIELFADLKIDGGIDYAYAGDTLDIVGMTDEIGKTTCTGVEMFQKTLDYGEAGDNGRRPSPTDVPVIDVTLTDARIGREVLGDWSTRIRPVDGGARAEALRGEWRGVQVDGNLTWTETGAGAQRTRYQGSVVSGDLKDTLTAWGLPVLLESDDARATLDLSWPDWPLSPDYLALTGDARLDIGECLIPDPQKRTSVLRVLGVLNVANIQRRQIGSHIAPHMACN